MRWGQIDEVWKMLIKFGNLLLVDTCMNWVWQ
jgi:hypothetical protein